MKGVGPCNPLPPEARCFCGPRPPGRATIVASVAKEKDRPGETVIARNKRASYDYDLGSRFEAGLVLKGSEVKMLRAGKASVLESFCTVERGEAFLHGVSILEMTHAAFGHRPKGARKLLLHRREIDELEIALARGKKIYDKRETIRTQDAEREARVALIHGQRRYGSG